MLGTLISSVPTDAIRDEVNEFLMMSAWLMVSAGIQGQTWPTGQLSGLSESTLTILVPEVPAPTGLSTPTIEIITAMSPRTVPGLTRLLRSGPMDAPSPLPEVSQS